MNSFSWADEVEYCRQYFIIYSVLPSNTIHTVDVLKLKTLFSFCSKKMLVFRAGIHQMPVRIANREDPDLQKHTDLSL